MLNLKPGQSGTAIFTFADNTQSPAVDYPLASAASLVVDPTDKVSLSMTADGTADGVVKATVTPIAGAAAGAFTITCTGDPGEGDPAIVGTLSGALLGPDDNSVTASFTIP